VLADEHGTPGSYQGYMEDVTEQKLAELATHESERCSARSWTGQLIAVMIDRTGLITFCNDHPLRLTGWSREELLGRNWYDVFPTLHRRIATSATCRRSRAARCRSRRDHHPHTRRRRADHHRNDMLLRDASGRVIGMTSISEDITERRRAEERVEYLAHYDELTGLPNRDLFGRWLDLAIERCHAHDRHVAVLFVSLDNFTLINDSLGHTAEMSFCASSQAVCGTLRSGPSWSPATAVTSSWCCGRYRRARRRRHPRRARGRRSDG
jgi:PAS domain S-box-containing protein